MNEDISPDNPPAALPGGSPDDRSRETPGPDNLVSETQASETPAPETPAKIQCRHEYIKIYQRKLKGLERRMVSTRAYLPLGFKTADFGHLGEGSFCFCTKCRTRLYPRRTQHEKLLARQALAASQEAARKAAAQEDLATENALIDVEELELESVGMEDIAAEGVKVGEDDESGQFIDDEEL